MKLMKLAIWILIVIINLVFDVSAAPILDKESGGYSALDVDNKNNASGSAASGEYGASGVDANSTGGLYNALQNDHAGTGRETIYQGLSADPLTGNANVDRGRAIQSLKQSQTVPGFSQNQPTAKRNIFADYAPSDFVTNAATQKFWYVPSSGALNSGAAFVQHLPNSALSERANVWFCGWNLADTGHISIGSECDEPTPSITSLIGGFGDAVVATPTGFQRTDIFLLSDTEMYLLIAGGIALLIYLLRSRK